MENKNKKMIAKIFKVDCSNLTLEEIQYITDVTAGITPNFTYTEFKASMSDSVVKTKINSLFSDFGDGLITMENFKEATIKSVFDIIKTIQTKHLDSLRRAESETVVIDAIQTLYSQKPLTLEACK